MKGLNRLKGSKVTHCQIMIHDKELFQTKMIEGEFYRGSVELFLLKMLIVLRLSAQQMLSSRFLCWRDKLTSMKQSNKKLILTCTIRLSIVLSDTSKETTMVDAEIVATKHKSAFKRFV